jgi:hypothetical protein
MQNEKAAIHFLYLALPMLFGCNEEEKPDQEAFIFGQWNLLCDGIACRFTNLRGKETQ